MDEQSHLLLVTFFLLVGVHFLCDFPLQGPYLSETKNPYGKNKEHWQVSMLAHVTIHGLGVFLVTGFLPLALAEMLYHAFIDYCKCRGDITFNFDQFLHICCKAMWAILYVYVILPNGVYT